MSKETAKQEIEQVCFAYEKAGKTGDKKDWKKFYKLENSLIAKVKKANQPKLSIPKKLATAVEFLKRELGAMEYVMEDEDIKGTYSERIATESAARIKKALADIGGEDD